MEGQDEGDGDEEEEEEEGVQNFSSSSMGSRGGM